MSQILNDLRLGEETKLSERFMGKQIYAKLIDFGALPAAGEEKAVAHGITGMDQFGIDHGRSYVDQGDGNRHALVYPNAVPNGFWRAKVSETDVSIHSGQDRSAFTAVICVWYTKADELPDQPDSGIDYSLEEQWTGKRWINGKKVYQKVISIGPLPNSQTKSVRHGIAGIEQFVDIRGACWGPGGGASPLPHVHPNGTSSISLWANSPTTVDVWPGTNRTTIINAYAILQYTCTDR